MRRGKRAIVLTSILVTWVAIVLTAYYIIHKPFLPANVLAVGEAVAGLAGAGMVVAAGAGIGLVLLRRLDFAPAERIVWAVAIGLGAVSFAGLALGAVGLLRPWLLWLLIVVGLATTGRRLWQALREGWVASSWRPMDRFERFLAGYCGLMLLFALVRALTPPIAWDGLVYHLTGPKLYLATGWISHPLDLPYLGFPQLVEMLFTWGMGLAGERAAAAVHWFYGLLIVLVLVNAGRRWMGGAVGWLAAAVLLSASSIVWLAGWPYVDLALLTYATLAFLALVRFREGSPPARRWLALSGVFTGLALSTKYTALALLPALGLALFLANHKSQISIRDPLFAIRDSLFLCAIVLAVWSPWLVKNFLLTGNPIYPFFFGGVYWDHWRAWWYDRPGTGLAYTAAWKLLTAPWDATVWGVEGAAGYSATIGPLFLALLPCLFLVWRGLLPEKRRWLGAAAVFCGVLYLFWLWGVARTALLLQTRLLFPAFGVLALIVGAAVEGLRALPSRPLDLAWLTRAIVAGVLALALTGTFLSTSQGRPLEVLLGHETQEDFLARRLGWYYAMIEFVNQELPPDAVVLFLWEPRSYHCQVRCWPDALLDRWLHTTHIHGYDATAIADDWRTEGVTHVLLYRVGYRAITDAGFDPVIEADQVALAQLFTEEMVQMADFGGAYELYAFSGGR